MPIVELVRMLAETAPLYLQRLDLAMVVGVVLLMVYSQYRRMAAVERGLYGFVKNRPAVQMGRATLHGLAGGLLATAIFIVMGISLPQVGVLYLWMLAIILMFFHPRFLCFSYGAGILSLAYLLTGQPQVDVPSLMALVAVLHLVEAVLIYWSGAEGATPLFVRTEDGRVVGGFSLQRFWPLPFVALIGAFVAPEMLRGVADFTMVNMPDWWPIIRPREVGGRGLEYAFALMPVVAALGYGDIAVTTLPSVKARRTALRLLAYSLGLAALAVLSQYHRAFALAAALYSPLAHEWVIRRARVMEAHGVPRFTGPETMVLDVHPRSPAARAGLGPGDVITAINGIPVHTRDDLARAMEPWSFSARIEVRNVFTGLRRTVECAEKIPPLGVILVPEPGSRAHVNLGGPSRAAVFWRRIASRWRFSR